MTQNYDNRLDQIESVLASHNQILNQLAPLTTQITELLARTAQRVENHEERFTQAEERFEQTRQLTQQNAQAIARLSDRVDALTTSTTETLRLVADNSIEIRRIWEYLLRQSGNGRN